MVNVANRPYVDVWLGPLELLLCHLFLSFLLAYCLAGRINLVSWRSLNAISIKAGSLDPPAFGAHNRIRTDDLALTKGVLCQLSYVGR